MPLDSAQTRVERRTHVLLTGQLVTASGTHAVCIKDLSSGGARLTTAEKIPSGCDAIFSRGQLFAAAQVIWSERGQVGVRFYRQLSAAETA
jgi:hypothetical protein